MFTLAAREILTLRAQRESLCLLVASAHHLLTAEMLAEVTLHLDRGPTSHTETRSRWLDRAVSILERVNR